MVSKVDAMEFLSSSSLVVESPAPEASAGFRGGGLAAQSCPTLVIPWTGPPGSSLHGISQARTLQWVAISASRGPFWPRDQTRLSFTAGEFLTAEAPGKPSGFNTNDVPSIVTAGLK